MNLSRAFGFAVAVLRIPPAQFWALGVPEYAAIAAALAAPPAAPERAGLDDLMRRFPDGAKPERQA